MPAHQRQIRRYGWKPQLPDRRDHSLKLESFPRRPLPPRLILTHPLPPFDQGQLGSCTANATVGAITFDQNVQAQNVTMESRLYLYYWSRYLENTVDSDSGAMLRDVMKAYNEWGICSEADYPYDISKFSEKPTVEGTCKPIHYGAITQSEYTIKHPIVSGFPVIFGFTVYNGFESETVAQTGMLNMPLEDEYPIGGHAVLMMGYDDEQKFPDGSVGGIYVRNSWGSAWGQSGYFWMPYTYVCDSQYASDFWVIDKISQPQV